MRFAITSNETRVSPLQFLVMNENSLYSILSYLLVPRGKLHTDISRPVSVESFSRSIFQRLIFEPLDPPPSAVLSNFFDSVYLLCPMEFHHFLMNWTANSAIYDRCRHSHILRWVSCPICSMYRFPHCKLHEVIHFDLMVFSGWFLFFFAVFEIVDQFSLLPFNGNNRLFLFKWKNLS